MAKFRLRKITWEDIDLDESDVMTFSEAARELDASVSTVITNAEAGRLSLVLREDEEKPWNVKRMVLREEIEAWKERDRE